MEWFLSLFILHDTLVVSLLVVGITIVVVMLLLMTSKSPESVVKSELGGNDNVETALRRVLGEQRWLQAGATTGSVAPGDQKKIGELEMEVLEKDRKIAELNKQMTHSGGMSEAIQAGDQSELLEKLAELEARLQEYEIIEDDIADLSLYKTENDKLRKEIEKLKSQIGGAVPVSTPAVEEIEEDPAVEPMQTAEPEGVDGADLVAEFEKVVNSQSQMSTEEPSSRVSIVPNKETGKVLMADEMGGGKTVVEEVPLPIHPKLKNISPDSKEEAEVFIAELKSFNNIRKRTGESE